MATTLQISRAQASDRPAISRTLAEAFQDDPVFAWIVADPAERRARLPAAFGAFADAYVGLEESYVTAEGAGAALWAPAGVNPFTEEKAEVFGQQMADALGPNAARALLLDELLQEHHPDEPCLYLQFVGVVPDLRGRGLGSRLLTTVLDPADATGIPAYLDATSPRNRRLYERHGFETIGEVSLPDGPTLWSMWRTPAAAVD